MISTDLVLLFHVTSAPKASDTALIGTIVRPFINWGGTSENTCRPLTTIRISLDALATAGVQTKINIESRIKNIFFKSISSLTVC